MTRGVEAPGTQNTFASSPLWTSGCDGLLWRHPLPRKGGSQPDRVWRVLSTEMWPERERAGVGGWAFPSSCPASPHFHRAAPDVESGNVTECHDSHFHISKIKRHLSIGVIRGWGPLVYVAVFPYSVACVSERVVCNSAPPEVAVSDGRQGNSETHSTGLL